MKHKQKKKFDFNIRKRLVISNILMIAIPVILCAILGLAGMELIWSVVIHGEALGFSDSEEFYEYAGGVSKLVEEVLIEKETPESTAEKLSRVLDNSEISLNIYEKDTLFYHTGTDPPELPENIQLAAELLDNECTVIQDDFYLYAHQIETEEHDYRLYLSAEAYAPSYETLRICMILLVLFLIAAVLICVHLTNRFLTRFVFRKIETPLTLLEYGVAQIRDGNLDYRIEYTENTEFLPVCNAFNEMAVRLKKSVEQTLQNEQSRKELLAGISHDIRSPLTSIQAYVEGLLDGIASTPEQQKKYLRTIKQKSENISNMVSQIFTFSKLELEDYPVNLMTTDVRAELEKILQPLQEEYEQKGLSIQLTAAHETLQIDTALLGRICTNLLSNSLKYNHNAHPQVEIFSESTPKHYFLHFADNGDGVEPEALDKLFEVFYRSDPARNHPEKGSGLGLAIVANASKRMNGTVHAENRKNGGLDIVLTLPKEENHG